MGSETRPLATAKWTRSRKLERGGVSPLSGSGRGRAPFKAEGRRLFRAAPDHQCEERERRRDEVPPPAGIPLGSSPLRIPAPHPRGPAQAQLPAFAKSTHVDVSERAAVALRLVTGGFHDRVA